MSLDSLNIVPPSLMSLDDILPQEPLLMMGAGPVPIPARVARANSLVVNHLGGAMAKVIEQVKVMAQYVFQTRSPWVMGVAGPGSAAMEMAAANLIEPGDTVLSISNGFFSNRMAQMAARVGANVIELKIDVKSAADPSLIREAMAQHNPKVLTMVQGETSNTVCNIHLKEIASIAKEYD